MLINTVLLTVLVLLITVLSLVLWRQNKRIREQQEAFREQEKIFLKQSEDVRKEQEQLEQYKKEVRDLIGKWEMEFGQNQSAVFREYQEMLLEDMQAPKRTAAYWKNPVLNMVFLHKLEECDSYRIAVSVEGFPENGISLSESSTSEMVGLFTNLFDNAIEACLHLPEDARWIRIQVTMERKRVLFVLENSCGEVSQPAQGERTWKKNKNEHGIGKDIIHEIVQRNNGWITFAQKEGIHRGKLMLPAGGTK